MHADLKPGAEHAHLAAGSELGEKEKALQGISK